MELFAAHNFPAYFKKLFSYTNAALRLVDIAGTISNLRVLSDLLEPLTAQLLIDYVT